MRHVCVRVNRKGESLCCVVVNGNKVPREPELAAYVTAAVPHTVGVLLNSNTRRGNVILGDKYRTLFGPELSDGHPLRPGIQAVRALLLSGEPGSGGGAVRQGAGIRGPYREGDGAGPLLRHRYHYPVPGEGRPNGSSARRSCPPPSGTPRRTPSAITSKTRSFSAATRRTSPPSWRATACGRMW